MIVPLLCVTYLFFYVIWDLKYSQASALLRVLRNAEPGIIASLEGWLLPLPSMLLGRIIGSGAYLKVESVPEIRHEIMKWQEKRFRRSFAPMALFVVYMLISLMIRSSIGV